MVTDEKAPQVGRDRPREVVVLEDSNFDMIFTDEDFEIEAKELDGHSGPGHLPGGVSGFGNIYFTS